MTQYHVSAQAAKTNPRFGGESATNRIVYRAAAGEPRPVITGSERIDTWQPEGDGVWKAVIPNAFFNGYNPYVETVFGDWTVYPDPKVEVRHLGDVYLNGKSFYEVASLDKVRNPQRWDTGRDAATDSIVPLIDPDATVNVWCCAVDDEATTIWANFHEADPNAELTEINVRETCFYPSRPFVNYITVSGFEMAQAACPYTPIRSGWWARIGPAGGLSKTIAFMTRNVRRSRWARRFPPATTNRRAPIVSPGTNTKKRPSTRRCMPAGRKA